jgi:hypothetical protein
VPLSRARVGRFLRKPPRYVAGRLVREATRRLQYVALRSALHGHGRLTAGRIVPGGAAAALDSTFEATLSLGAWEDAIEAMASLPVMRSDIQERGARAEARLVEVFGDQSVSAGVPPRWNEDLRTGLGWPKKWHAAIDYRNIGRPSDVKVAWELSRLRHCVAMAQCIALGESRLTSELERDLRDWTRQNPLGWSVNWSSAMEVALRAVNLICIDGILAASGEGSHLRPLLVPMLYQHGWFLRRNLEISDLNGNHYLANAVGLLWLGRYFAGVGDGDEWRAHGLDMTRDAVAAQILGDGLDHEGSLRYHALVLELFALALVAGRDDLAACRTSIGAMSEALEELLGSDGTIPDIGDDDGGRVSALSSVPASDGRRVVCLASAVLDSPTRLALGDRLYAQDALWLKGLGAIQRDFFPEPRSRPVAFSEAGLVAMGDGEDHLVASVGPVGFRGRGGHGHLDAMSFVCSLSGQLVVRDSGTGSYTGDTAVRQALRGAEAHSVVVIDGLPYARLGDVDHLWLILGDSEPRVVRVASDRGAQVLEVEQALPCRHGSATHRRELRWTRGQLECVDRVTAPDGSHVKHFLQVPDDTVQTGDGLSSGSASYELDAPTDAKLSLTSSLRSERYGTWKQGRRAEVEYTARGGEALLRWMLRAL